MQRTPAILAGLLALTNVAGACPWVRRYCCPPPGYYVPAPPPVVYYPPPAPPAPAAEPAPPAKPPAPEPIDDPAELYKRVVDSVVFIVVPLKGGHAEGSGSLIDKEKRLVITNSHIVGEQDLLFVLFPVHEKDGSILRDKKKYFERIPAGEALKGKVLYRDKTRDLAIVQLDSLPPTAKQIPLARKSPEIGSSIWRFGSPGAVDHTFSVTTGKVRAVGVEDFIVGVGDDAQRINCKMVVAANPSSTADSGGPAVNRFGELVAVAESGQSGAQLLNMYIDVTEVLAFLADKKIVLSGDEGPTPGRDRQPPRSPQGMGLPRRGLDGQLFMPGEPGYPGDETDPNGERAAAQLLQRAKLFEEGEDNRPTYINKLKAVVKKYPDTAAGKEAKKLLDRMPK